MNDLVTRIIAGVFLLLVGYFINDVSQSINEFEGKIGDLETKVGRLIEEQEKLPTAVAKATGSAVDAQIAKAANREFVLSSALVKQMEAAAKKLQGGPGKIPLQIPAVIGN